MKTLALTVAGGFALSSALAAPTAEPQLAPGPKLLENTRVEWRVKLPEPGGFTIRTGRPGESFGITTRPDEQSMFVWRVEYPFAAKWRREGIQRVGGVSRPNFGWNPLVLAWDGHYRALKKSAPMSGHEFRVALELVPGEVRLYADGALLTCVPVTDDLAGHALAAEARRQIDEKNYAASLEAEGVTDILKFGYAFRNQRGAIAK